MEALQVIVTTLKCWTLVGTLAGYPIPPDKSMHRAHICVRIIAESESIGLDPTIPLAIGWLESTYTDATGKPITTRSGRVVRASGPLQVLKFYHCRREPNCDTLKVGIDLLDRLITQHGPRKGIATYAGGYINPKSMRYSRRALRLRKKIKSFFRKI